jgi:hypothetical protein
LTNRQNLAPDEAGIEDPVVSDENAGTSSRLHPLERPKFGELLTYFLLGQLRAYGASVVGGPPAYSPVGKCGNTRSSSGFHSEQY